MRTNVLARHMEVTDAIRQHAESKVKRLKKYDDLIQQIDIKFWKENSSQEQYTVETVVDVINHNDFIAKAEGHDLYLVIDDAINKVDRQLNDHREKLKIESQRS